MTIRPIFITTNNIIDPVHEENIEFNWIKGLSYSQKCKRREEFHKAIAKKYNINRVLEVSTKSNYDIGIKLSALNLKFSYMNISDTVENIYQSSKCYDDANKIKSFKYKDIIFEITPKNMFYDWLYITALKQNPTYIKQIEQFDIFTDIEFNPKKSINSQARATAIFKTLHNNNMLEVKTESIDVFKKYYKDIFKQSEQVSLF